MLLGWGDKLHASIGTGRGMPMFMFMFKPG